MSIEKITNYIRVSNQIASSGQPRMEHFKYIAREGYQLVINLAMPNSPGALHEESDIVALHQIIYVHIPVPFETPQISHLNDFFRVMEAFRNKRIWVHCIKNYRASAFLYLYRRFVQEIRIEEARKIILPSWTPNPVWKQFMELTSKDLNAYFEGNFKSTDKIRKYIK